VKLSIFLICLIIAAIGIGFLVDFVTRTTTQVPVYSTPASQYFKKPTGYITRTSGGVGWAASIAVIGIGAGIGVPLILRRKTN
jgi:hypothetical protein